VDGRAVGKAGLGIDAAGRGELEHAVCATAGIDVAKHQITRGLADIDAVRRLKLIEITDSRARQGEQQRVVILCGIHPGEGSRADAAGLRDQRSLPTFGVRFDGSDAAYSGTEGTHSLIIHSARLVRIVPCALRTRWSKCLASTF